MRLLHQQCRLVWIFEKRVLSFISPMPNSIYNIHKPLGVKYLTKLIIGFSHLKEHKLKHNFQYWIDPIWKCKFLSCFKALNTKKSNMFNALLVKVNGKNLIPMYNSSFIPLLKWVHHPFILPSFYVNISFNSYPCIF